ncbi:MAG TPA: acyl-CoA thioesterase [Flavipsychrobacter sp.]
MEKLNKKRKDKTPAMSETIMTEVVYPNDANPIGMLQGGRLVQWMDTASAICAQTHAGRIAVTASINKVEFKSPAKVGDIISINAKVTRAFDRSMEIYVYASSRKVISGEIYPICEAYFVFVALDDNANPTTVPALKPETATEKTFYKNALVRREGKGI